MDFAYLADIASDVTVVFDDEAITMPVAAGSTLADLAELMAELGAEHRRKPVYVRVRCGGSRVSSQPRANRGIVYAA